MADQKVNPFGGKSSGGEYDSNSENGILDLSEGTVDFSDQGYKGQPGLMGKRGDDPLEVDPGTVPYPMPIKNDKPEYNSPANKPSGE
jgi:hypothetical protein